MKTTDGNFKSNINSHDFLLVLKTHLAEYRHKPLLNIGFIFSLAIATSTLLCILVLNHASKQQYQQANSRLKSPIAFNILAKSDKNIDQQDFIRLKKLGFHQLSPVHSFQKKLINGKSLSLRALDLLPMVLSMPESFTSKQINISSDYANSLGLIDNKNKISPDAINTSTVDIGFAEHVSTTARLNTVNDWGKVALIDIALAWQLFPDIKGFSHLMVPAMSDHEIARLTAELPEHLFIQQSYSIEEREGFADALHLNLSALAVLGFIVSLFIAFQAANQAWRKRGELAAQLRLLGVELRTILTVMLCESLLLTLLASLIGIVIAMALVTTLLPILGITLEQLYQLRLSGHFQWHWHYSLWAFIISAVAVLLALIKQFKSISSAKIALTAQAAHKPFNYRASFIISLLLLSAYFLLPFLSATALNSNSLLASNAWLNLMMKNSLLLIASVAILPNLLRYLFVGLAHFSRSFRLKYLLKDVSQQVGVRYLPLAAFYLALTASISAALMVNSFESSFVAYLNQLLSSDLFISYNKEQKPRIETWLKQHPDIEEYMLFEQTVAKYKGETIAVHALHSKTQTNSLVFKSKSVNVALLETKVPNTNIQNNTCYINEQLSLKRGLSLSDSLTVRQVNNALTCVIQGIYYDYGNQGLAIKIPITMNDRPLTGWYEKGFGVLLSEKSSLTKQQVATALKLDAQQIYQPEQIKQLALGIFKQTFVLTQAIAFVLLTIACFGLFLSANGLELARKADLYTLSSLGYSRLGLFGHMIAQWLLLATGTILLSWPIASLLAKALVSEILPASFGWSMPLVLDIMPFAISSIIGLIILIPALAIPLYKLNVRASLS
ncbi:MAG: ABC transporter permease [Colwellia sp.]|nr:ABC transporter permease [Colwellia sp.]